MSVSKQAHMPTYYFLLRRVKIAHAKRFGNFLREVNCIYMLKTNNRNSKKQDVKSAQSKNKDFTICTHRIRGVWSIFPACLITLVGICMPKVNIRNTRRCDKVWNQFKSKNKDFIMTSVLLSLLLTWSIFNAWFQSICC